MRAAILPTPGDPLLAAYWVRNFQQVWADEVDELAVLVNGQTDPAALEFVTQLFRAAKPGTVTTVGVFTDRLDHGVALRRLIESCEADVVMLAEDDAYVRKPGAVDAHFRLIEDDLCDVAGSPRGCASKELIVAAQNRWPNVLGTPSLDEGHGLWPAFLFSRKETLLETDRHFGARMWQPGELVDGLDYEPAIAVSADTFVSTSYQLRDANLRIRHEPQYRLVAGAMGEWINHDPIWFHVGSLSSGYGTAFDDHGGRRTLDLSLEDTTSTEEWARRLYWWERFGEVAGPELRHLRDQYQAAVADLIRRTGTRLHVDRWASSFGPWINWSES